MYRELGNYLNKFITITYGSDTTVRGTLLEIHNDMNVADNYHYVVLTTTNYSKYYIRMNAINSFCLEK